MKIINNITEKLSDELKQDLRAGSRLSIAAACFSVYAFEELKTQLLQIDALRFIFTSPTFLAEQPKQEQREFYIPRRNREKALHGSEFEIRLRNAFTQRAISKECADWIRQKAVFKSNNSDAELRTTDQLMRMLDFDFFEILDSVTIARSRRHIEKYYNMNEIGHFPTRLPPISKRPPLTDLSDAITYGEIYDLIISLTLSIYTPSNYILPSRMAKYADLNHEGKNSLTQAGREQGIRRLMSINLLLESESAPVVWRGPVISGVINQFWSDVRWGELDYLFVDMPPGTGDVALTVFQGLPVDGIVIVTTPQDLVQMIVEKAFNMAKMMKVPVLGLVENMSSYVCPDCGKSHPLFGTSKVEETAAALGVPVLAKLPLDPAVNALVDAGRVEDVQRPELQDFIDVLKGYGD